LTGNEFFRTITEEILDYVVREMTYVGAGANDGNATDKVGGVAFSSTQDADPTTLRSGDDRSEGEEGKFFVWTPDEIRDVLGDEADAFMAAYGATRHGNFEGKNILKFVGELEQPLLWRTRVASCSKPARSGCTPAATTCNWR
jgi:hypothetical protein